MSQLPKPDSAQLRARYPDVFDRPASARLAIPAMIVAASAIFLFGLVDLDFGPIYEAWRDTPPLPADKFQAGDMLWCTPHAAQEGGAA